MLIIGEKINGTLKGVGPAIVARDSAFIQDLARRQVEAGADVLDVNAGTPPETEPEDMRWLVRTVQAVVTVPLCIDSANPEALAAGLQVHQGKAIINSTSGEERRLENILPLAKEFDCAVVGLALDEGGISESVTGRLAASEKIVSAAVKYGIPLERVYIDPLVLSVSTNTKEALISLQTLRGVKERFPGVKTISGLSNVSFGLPNRALINRAFLVLLMGVGLDAAILNPLDKELMATIKATELLLNRDEYCMGYLKAYREGKL